ncbi:MAG TPA: MFS transporter [Longilinea sp.]|nr:MFS transporter [Longilinea sp.]
MRLKRPWSTIEWLRLFYFVSSGGSAFISPFMTLFYRQQGMSGTQIGLLATLSALTAMIIAPVWTRLGGAGDRLRRTLQIMLFGTLLMLLWLSQQTTFLTLAIVLCMLELFSAAVTPASDSLASGILAQTPGDGFGSVRVFGSLGWALVAFLGGWLIQRTGMFSGFAAAAVGLGVSVLILFRVRVPVAEADNNREVGSQRHWFSLAALHNPALLGFASALSAYWLVQIGLINFEPIYMKQLGAGEAVIGLASTVGAAVEVGGMLLADRMVRRYGSKKVLSISFLISTAAMLLVLIFPAVATILLIHAIDGIAFSFLAVSSVVFISQSTCPQETATAMALITVTLYSLSSMIGSSLSGLVFDAFGAYWLYAIAMGGYLLAWLVLGRVRQSAA